MTIKVTIKRHVRHRKEAKLDSLLIELRSRSLRRNGYLSGETLVSAADQRRVREVAASRLGSPRRRGGGDARALGNDRTGDLAGETVRIDDVFGNHIRPPGADAVLAKFRSNAARSLKSDGVGALERAVQQLVAARDLKALSAALRQTNEAAA